MAKRNRNKPRWYNLSNIPLGNSPAIRRRHKGEIAIDIPLYKSNEIVAWCKTVFGEDGNNRRYSWRINNATRTRIFLRSEQQVMLFKLKWL